MKKAIMKVPAIFFSLSLLIGFVSCPVAQNARKFSDVKFPNYLAGTHWKVNRIPFENKEQESYSFSTYDALDFNSHWGHFISFDSLTFSSSYSAPCGNDCFTSVKGTYWFSAENRIRVKVSEITRNGFCEKKSETINQDYGYYDLTKTDQGWHLKKVQ